MIKTKTVHHITDTLMEVAFIYGVALVLFALAFSYIEGETFIRSMYWAGITSTSTGYGDITPKTTMGMILAFLLTHLSIFIIAPLIIVHMTQRVLKDDNAWTHEEQEEIKKTLQRIEEKLK